MNYFAAYWRQIKQFYIHMWHNLFAKERNLDGELSQYTPKRGFIWDFIDMHKLLAISVLRVPLILLQILFGYVVGAFIIALLIVTPVLIVVLFPLFSINRWRRLRKEASKL